MTFLDFAQDCPAGVLQKTMLVTGRHTDARGRMRPGNLARLIGDAAVEHLALFGTELATLQAHGLLWVLARTALRVERLPHNGEIVLLRAWAGKEKHWMYPYRYVIYSAAGEALVSACSHWLLMDEATRSLAPPSDLMESIPAVSLPGEPKAPALQMVFPEELPGRRERTPLPGEIDLNGHLNNSHYLDWAAELPDEAFLREHALHSLWVEYSKEVLAGQSVNLLYGQDENTLFVRGQTGGEDSFSLKMEYGREESF